MQPVRDKTWVVSLLDCVVFLDHILRFAEKHGKDFDADHTVNDLSEELAAKVRLPRSIVESAMYCCNLLDEEQEFKHPNRMCFDAFAMRVGQGRPFNKRYNWFEDPK